MSDKDNSNVIKSVIKTLTVLDCFNFKEEFAFNELKKITKFDSSTLTRILKSLIYKEYKLFNILLFES